jgi:NAD(P)-dependent dehydrogenase (short-subunit alcohol dehydrogenase family)
MAIWFITGAARGLGFEIATRALNAGHSVVATARNVGQVELAFADSPAFPERVLPVALDVTDEAQAKAAADAAISRFGSLDFLVNNAGRGLLGAVEEASAAEVEAVFATNVFGVLNVMRAILPHMRAARSGHVVNIGSMGGFAQVAGWGVYGATKFALEGLSEAMHTELAPLGVSVTIVEPGSFRTNFLDGSSLQKMSREFPDYAQTAGLMRQVVTVSNGGQLSDPVKGAAAIFAAVTASQPPFRFQVGPDAVAMVEAKLSAVRNELETWRDLASSTVFADAAPSKSV